MTSVSAGHIILTPTQPVGSGRAQGVSNPGAPHQESRALPTELPRPRTEGRCTAKTCTATKITTSTPTPPLSSTKTIRIR